jgi:two-component system sensor histidine kinase HydH
MTGRSALLGPLLVLLSAVLPLAVLAGAIRTVRTLEQQKEEFLRSRAAAIAAWLETLEDPEQIAGIRERLLEEDHAVLDIAVFPLDKPAPEVPEELVRGRALFQVSRIEQEGEPVFRVWLPCHIGGGVYLARLDLAEEVADSLIRPARENVWLASAGSLGLIALALALSWSARRAARAERRQAELEHLARLGELSAVLAHEIRNPLGTIKGFAQLLSEKADARQRELLEPILNETTRLEDLVRDLLLYGRPPQVSPRPVSAAQFATTLERHAARWLEGRPVRLIVEGEPLELTTDPDLLERALLNLVQNAVEAVADEPDGQVRLRFSAGRGGLSITVSDNGPGLSDEMRRHLFEPFRTTKASGTGLGLAITRKLVASLGGTLELDNRPEGGVEARLWLPAAPRK